MHNNIIIKRILKLILFAAIAVLLTFFLDMAFELPESDSEIMLINYSRAKDIDTVLIGSSVGKAIMPEVYRKIAGDNAVNMCTSAQSFGTSYKNLKLAASQHKIKHAVLLMTFDSLDDSDTTAIDHLYDRTINSAGSAGDVIVNTLNYNITKEKQPGILSREESINLWIPWVNETSHGFKQIDNNITSRFMRLLSGNSLGCAFGEDFTTPKYNLIEKSPSEDDMQIFKSDLDEASAISASQITINPEKLEILNDIIRFCSDNSIKLGIVVTPHPASYYKRYASFEENINSVDHFMNNFCRKRNIPYFNAENDPELHKILPDSYFLDSEHIKDDYLPEASDYLSNIICTEVFRQ